MIYHWQPGPRQGPFCRSAELQYRDFPHRGSYVPAPCVSSTCVSAPYRAESKLLSHLNAYSKKIYKFLSHRSWSETDAKATPANRANTCYKLVGRHMKPPSASTKSVKQSVVETQAGRVERGAVKAYLRHLNSFSFTAPPSGCEDNDSHAAINLI